MPRDIQVGPKVLFAQSRLGFRGQLFEINDVVS